MRRTWDRIVRPASVALERVEAWGVPCDRAQIEQFDQYLYAREQKAKATLDQYAPDVNWRSPDQVATVLFDRLKLKAVALTETGKRSTAEEVLVKLASKHPLPAALVEHRFITRMRGTYASGMLEHVRADRSTGYPWHRIHPNVKLDGARSGRTSCTDPNLQNIPRPDGSPEGKMARDCFAAPPGYKLVELDYSQLELRVACLLSRDPKMLEIFKSGVDYHLRTAQLVSKLAWGVDDLMQLDKAAAKEYRSRAKAVNFGVLYGKGAGGLAAEWGCKVDDAQRVIDLIMGQFKVLDTWCDARLAEARKTGIVWTWWDGENARRRPLWRVADKSQENDASRNRAENGAVNSPIQGTASDFCIASLTACVDWIEQDCVPGTKLVLPVHDALMFEVRDDMVDEVAHTAAHIMRSWPFGDVPLVVDCKVGQSWGSMVDYDVAA
jgi:DNA polymerase-1